MFLLFLKGGVCIVFRNPLELLTGLGAFAGGVEEVRTVSSRLVQIKTFGGDTFLVSMVPPTDLVTFIELPLLPFSIEASRVYRDT